MKTRRLRITITTKEYEALTQALERAYHDAWDYLLGPHAKLDYCDQYAAVCRAQASQFRDLVAVMYGLGLSEDTRRPWVELAGMLEKIAEREQREAANVNP